MIDDPEQRWSCNCWVSSKHMVYDQDANYWTLTNHNNSCLTNRLKNATNGKLTELPRFNEEIDYTHESEDNIFASKVSKQPCGFNVNGTITCNKAECCRKRDLSERTKSTVRQNIDFDVAEVTSDQIAQGCKGPWKPERTVAKRDLGDVSSTYELQPVLPKKYVWRKAPDFEELESADEITSDLVAIS